MKTRLKPWEPREQHKLYCAAIATSVAGIAAAGASAYSQFSAAGSAKAPGNKAGAYGTKLVLQPFKSNVDLPKFDPNAGANDFSNSLPMLTSIASRITKKDTHLRDSQTGGNSSAVLQQEGVDINSLLHGTVSADVQGSVNRMVAERSGGAFSPTGQVGQAASDDFARSIGKTSADMMHEGLTMAPQWESLVDAFTYKPQDAANFALNALRARNDYTINAGQLQNKIDEDTYTGLVNQAKAASLPDPQITGAFNDQQALGAVKGQDTQNGISALLGAFKGATGLFAGGGAGGGASAINDAGFYTSAGAAATAGQGAPIATYYGPGSTTPQYYISG